METSSGKVVSHCRAIRTLFSKNICQWRLLYRLLLIENKEETKVEVTQRNINANIDEHLALIRCQERRIFSFYTKKG